MGEGVGDGLAMFLFVIQRKHMLCYSAETYVVTPHEICLGETVLMIDRNMCFREDMEDCPWAVPFAPSYPKHC